MVSINEQIKILVELQCLDSEIYKLNAESRQIPPTIQYLENDLKTKQDSLKNLDKKSKAIQLKRKEKELELSSKEETNKKAQVQLYTLKTNKEYQLKLQEITGVKADCSLLEEEIIKILDDADSLSQEIKKEKDNLSLEEKKFIDTKLKYEDRLKEIEDRLGVLDVQRKGILVKIEPRILNQYEKVLKNREGLGIVLAKDGSCQGCFMSVTHQAVNEIKMNKMIITCSACQRILYLEDE